MRTSGFLVLQLFCLILTIFYSRVNAQPRDFTKLVNPFVGTIGTGNTFNGPVLPYGMVQPGPYLKYTDDQKSGTIYGFSHTHLSGMAGGGNGTPGDIIFMDPFLCGTSYRTIHS